MQGSGFRPTILAAFRPVCGLSATRGAESEHCRRKAIHSGPHRTPLYAVQCVKILLRRIDLLTHGLGNPWLNIVDLDERSLGSSRLGPSALLTGQVAHSADTKSEIGGHHGTQQRQTSSA